MASLAPSADVWFLDIWGVLHNGVKPYAAAVDACTAFRKAGGNVVLVSNSPRPHGGVISQLNDIGVDPAAYDDVVTSGDVSRALIAEIAPGPVLHIGPKRDLPLFEGVGVAFAAVDAAKFAVCTGLFNDNIETPDDYTELLAKMKSQKTPMICANPDIKVERGGKIIYCAGAVAQAYEALGGDVRYAGKPHAPIYGAALDIAARLRGFALEKTRVLAIGDGIATDIRGASRAGIRSVYVASGVHLTRGMPLAEAAEMLFANETVKPIAVMTALAW